MTSPSKALSSVPEGLRGPLLAEYESIVQNYAEHRWSPSELSGGKFCEIVYSILDGFGKKSYVDRPNKPADFVGACRRLEQNAHVPRSFQILIPRLLPALFEVRNNRGVGHAGGDVDPNHMDATFVLTNCNWIMAELVRVYHGLPITTAQEVVDRLVERRIPLIWEGQSVRRVLAPNMKLKQQILVLLATTSKNTSPGQLIEWIEYNDRSYFFKLLRTMHSDRLIELSKNESEVAILPPGSKIAADIIQSTK